MLWTTMLCTIHCPIKMVSMITALCSKSTSFGFLVKQRWIFKLGKALLSIFYTMLQRHLVCTTASRNCLFIAKCNKISKRQFLIGWYKLQHSLLFAFCIEISLSFEMVKVKAFRYDWETGFNIMDQCLGLKWTL